MADIYNDPHQYAKKVSCSLEIALKRCKFFRDIEQESKRAMVCPQCGEQSLRIDYDNLSGKEHVTCNNCSYESGISERFKPLQQYEDTIDLVLYGSKCKEVFGSWSDFVQKDTAALFEPQLD
jgi:Uncharacterized Zn ribbon-containing protein